MHWFKQLAELYGERDITLFHSEAFTDIEVRLTHDGNFVGAETDRIRTIIPVTERSASRTNGIQPHPLCDSLRYTAGDICSFIGRDEHIIRCNVAYLKQLKEWADSPFATQELCAVYRYLSQKTLFSDLLTTGIFRGCCDARIQKAVVRFSVGDVRLWEDSLIRKSHIAYVRSEMQCDTLCCVSGKPYAAAVSHPKRITGQASSAKLIGSGQLPIGYETSFRAHAVLKRLIAESGVRIGHKVFVAWDETGNGAVLNGEVTVLVLQEVNRGNLAVALYGRMDARRYNEIVGLNMHNDGNHIIALMTEQKLGRELTYHRRMQEIGS